MHDAERDIQTAQCGSDLLECPKLAASILAAFVEVNVSVLEPVERKFNVKNWRHMEVWP